MAWTVIAQIAAAAVVGAGLCGIVAAISPRTFAAIAALARRRVESQRWLAWLDREVDIDRYILKHSRLFGLSTLALILFSVWLLVGAA